MSPTCRWLSQAEITAFSKSQHVLPWSLYLCHDTSLTSVVTKLRSARKLKLMLSLLPPWKAVPENRSYKAVSPLHPGTFAVFQCHSTNLLPLLSGPASTTLLNLTRPSYPFSRTAPQAQSPSRSGARFPFGRWRDSGMG